MKIEFQVVKVRGSKSCKCVCGKKFKRSRTFEQTINPFNKSKDGLPKSFGQIHEELLDEKKEWLNKEELCSNCLDN